MTVNIDSRREYEQGEFVYLLDDKEKTAWIAQWHIGRRSLYRIPDYVTIEGECYIVEGMNESACFNHPSTLQHLVIPDTIKWTMGAIRSFDNLLSVHIGKRFKEESDFCDFINCPKLQNIQIDKKNPYIKYDNGMILSKDGKELYRSLINHSHVIIPDGVEEISGNAFIENNNMESLTFPKSLRLINGLCFSGCRNLRSIVLNEGFEMFINDCFENDEKLTHVDLPSTLINLGSGTFSGCPNLETVVLRSPRKLEFNKCFDPSLNMFASLYVPANLVEAYQQDPEWGVFQHILPICEKAS